MVSTLADRGSFLTAEDFAGHRGEAVAPIAGHYRGLDILELPPNTQGITALLLLNILARFDLAALDPLGPDRFHIALEAARLAYAVRDAHIAEPRCMRVPVAALLGAEFAADLAARIDRDRRIALPAAPARGGDTVYLTVVDRDRMAVSLINTLYSYFGVGICTPATGIMLTNRGACFVLDPAHPNAFGPGKRPMHTIIPALAMRDGRCELAFGVMGAHYQPMGHMQIVTNMVDHGHGRAVRDRRAAGVLCRPADRRRTRPASRHCARPHGARSPRCARRLAVGRRAGHRHRLATRRADRRLGPPQRRVRARIL